MTSLSDGPPLARISSPGEIAAIVPMLIGFVPTESVVVVSLRPPRARVGLTLRIDLPAGEHEELLAEQLAARMVKDRAAGAIVVVYTEAADTGDRRPRHPLVTALRAAAPMPVTEALLVRGQRWWSYDCVQPGCCPPEGTLIEAGATPTLRLVDAQAVLAGRVVLRSREELVRSVAAPELLAAAAARRRLDGAAGRAAGLTTAVEQAPAARGRAAVNAARDLLEVSARRDRLSLDAVAAFAVSLQDAMVRDEVATWALDRADDLLALLLQVVRQVVPPYDAPVCTVLAWVAYAGGDGGLANVALDRALDTDPEYALALLLRSALDGQIAPQDIRRILRGTRAALTARPG